MVGVTLVSLTALSVFHNAQIINRREDAPRRDVVETGDPFDAPWLVAKDLVVAKLAKPDDPEDLDDEPSEAVEPHPSLSAPELKRHNARRKDRAARDDVGPRSAVTGFELSRPAPVAAVAADTLPPIDLAPSAPVIDASPQPPAPAAPASAASSAKSNVPPIPPAPGVAD